MSSIIKKQGNVLILVSAMARHGSTKQLLLQSYFVNNYKNSYHSYEAAGNSLYLQKDIALLYRERHTTAVVSIQQEAWLHKGLKDYSINQKAREVLVVLSVTACFPTYYGSEQD